MGKVKVLSEDIVSLISAGEVIENPSSIVKELIENSLDARANIIDIAIERGGIDKIVVADNGSGISREDCSISLQRYSTSKISRKEDIDTICTYGFRGEALASISSVADVQITTQAEDEVTGTIVTAHSGQKPLIKETSRLAGTTVLVTDLFRGIPARRKHLSDSKVEAQRIHEVVMKHAAIRNDVGFRFHRNGNVVIDCPPGQSSRDRITYLWGSDIAKSLVDIDYSIGEIRLTGFIVRPPISRGNRAREYFSVLKRPITDEKLSRALESAYSTILMKGQYPVCALDVEVQISHVDVNVHPTKREVRLLEIDKVCAAIKNAVLNALRGPMDKYKTATLDSVQQQTVEQKAEFVQESLTGQPINEEQIKAIPLIEQTILEAAFQTLEEKHELNFLGEIFRIIGQTHNLYILLEYEGGFLIIDQHAAHERILYEQLRREVNENRVAVQELLQPFILSLSPKDIEQIVDLGETLEHIGYTINSFGGNEVSITTLPEILGRTASEKELLVLLDQIIDLGRQNAKDVFMDELVKLTACHSAVRAGQALSIEKIRNILEDLARTDNKYNCCHGRPSMVRIRKVDIDRSVGRLGPEAIARHRARHGLY